MDAPHSTARRELDKNPGTGYLPMLPVDRGIEHSAGAFFAANPDYFDPENNVKLAVEGGCNEMASASQDRGFPLHRYAHKIPFHLKFNNNEFVYATNQPQWAELGFSSLAMGRSVKQNLPTSNLDYVEVGAAAWASSSVASPSRTTLTTLKPVWREVAAPRMRSPERREHASGSSTPTGGTSGGAQVACRVAKKRRIPRKAARQADWRYGEASRLEGGRLGTSKGILLSLRCLSRATREAVEAAALGRDMSTTLVSFQRPNGFLEVRE